MATPSSRTDSTPRVRSFPRITALVAGVAFLLLGVWAMVAPQAFFDSVAVFPPYNQHFLQDVGAFQIGLGAVLLLGVAAPANGLGVALLGVGIGSAAHTISHLIGHDLGGSPATDIPSFTFLSVVLLAAGWQQWRHTSAY